MTQRACMLASMAGGPGVAAGIASLRGGSHPLDAVETVIRLVEADPRERFVGFGGAPNVLGQVELDASIMDGRTLKAGAVGSLKGFIHPISIARQVMERLPHVFLAGDGAARFARELAAEAGPTLSPEAEADWRAWLEHNARPAETIQNNAEQPLAGLVWRTVRPEATDDAPPTHGTVVVLAADREGNFAGGVSTSGWSYKYPGRLGDSPVIGAGLYVDNRYGAAGCIGHGELAIRASTARSVVLYMKMGASVQDAVHEAAHDVRRLKRDFSAALAIHALDHDGQPYVLMLGADPGMRLYYYWSEGAEASEVAVTRAEW